MNDVQSLDKPHSLPTTPGLQPAFRVEGAATRHHVPPAASEDFVAKPVQRCMVTHMNKRLVAWIGLGFVFSMTMVAHGATRAELWKQVDEAVQKGLPQTATNLLAPIIQQALADRAFGEAAKAIARRIVLEGNIQGNKPEEKIARLEAEIARAPMELIPLLTTLQADWFWHYFQQNRWRFMQRTQTATQPGKDFTTWDLPRLFS